MSRVEREKRGIQSYGRKKEREEDGKGGGSAGFLEVTVTVLFERVWDSPTWRVPDTHSAGPGSLVGSIDSQWWGTGGDGICSPGLRVDTPEWWKHERVLAVRRARRLQCLAVYVRGCDW